jgi:hypothetical protein
MRHARLEAIAVNNQEEYLANPEDEEAVRREMGEKCIAKFEMSDVRAFFAKSVNPALNAFALLSDPETIDKDRFEIDVRGDPSYHEGVLDGLPYSAFSLGFCVTTSNWLFYYSVYTMSPPLAPFGPYCVFVKSDGKYRTINDLEACSKDALFEDVKRSFLEAKAQLES